MKHYYKCRFCNWKTLTWVSKKNGKPKNLYSRLEYHVMVHHWEEYQNVIDRVALETGEGVR